VPEMRPFASAGQRFFVWLRPRTPGKTLWPEPGPNALSRVSQSIVEFVFFVAKNSKGNHEKTKTRNASASPFFVLSCPFVPWWRCFFLIPTCPDWDSRDQVPALAGSMLRK
jgi:hypothetical protein